MAATTTLVCLYKDYIFCCNGPSDVPKGLNKDYLSYSSKVLVTGVFPFLNQWELSLCKGVCSAWRHAVYANQQVILFLRINRAPMSITHMRFIQRSLYNWGHVPKIHAPNISLLQKIDKRLTTTVSPTIAPTR